MFAQIGCVLTDRFALRLRYHDNQYIPPAPVCTLSSMTPRKGATPVPGPTMMMGVSSDLGNDIVPFFTHTGTETGPATWR